MEGLLTPGAATLAMPVNQLKNGTGWDRTMFPISEFKLLYAITSTVISILKVSLTTKLLTRKTRYLSTKLSVHAKKDKILQFNIIVEIVWCTVFPNAPDHVWNTGRMAPVSSSVIICHHTKTDLALSWQVISDGVCQFIALQEEWAGLKECGTTYKITRLWWGILKSNEDSTKRWVGKEEPEQTPKNADTGR